MKARTVLIVDDDRDLGSELALRFERKGFRVIAAADGHGALEKFEDCHPDVVILDVHMPDLDGISVFREIRDRDPQAKIILMSEKITEDQMRIAVEEGAVNFIAKPLVLACLEDAVNAILNSDGFRRPLEFSQGDSSMEPFSDRGSAMP